jgi:hypothetical protein
MAETPLEALRSAVSEMEAIAAGVREKVTAVRAAAASSNNQALQDALTELELLADHLDLLSFSSNEVVLKNSTPPQETLTSICERAAAGSGGEFGWNYDSDQSRGIN